MILLAVVAFWLFAMVGYAVVMDILAGPDRDITEADRDTMCYRCGVRGLKHVHLSDR